MKASFVTRFIEVYLNKEINVQYQAIPLRIHFDVHFVSYKILTHVKVSDRIDFQ